MLTNKLIPFYRKNDAIFILFYKTNITISLKYTERRYKACSQNNLNNYVMRQIVRRYLGSAWSEYLLEVENVLEALAWHKR